jgi:UDP-GlcNAc:undecaprenyl-phosphate GlcNAc-1-phosphate transferase
MQILVFPIALIASAVATEVTVRFSRAHHLLDQPNNRSSHTVPTPRLGGIGIAIGFLVGVALCGRSLERASVANVLITIGIYGGVGFVDDLWSLSPKAKYVGQLAATATFVALSTRSPWHLPYICIPVALLWVTGFTNAFNFMDGINGLCGGTGILYSIFLSLVAMRLHDETSATLGFILAAACAGFLPHNFPHARTFMGDTGSMVIGAGLAVLSVRLVLEGGITAAAAVLLIVAAFLYDTTFTILRRLRYRQNILTPHRSHLYQRLVRAGKSHVEVSTLYFACHFGLGALSVLGVHRSNLFLTVSCLISGLMLALLTFYVHYLENCRPVLHREASETVHA